MNRLSERVLLTTAAFALLLVPVAAMAAGGFTDVGDDSVFKTDIQWLADAGVTRGCNPPTNDRFCPEDYVTREQMAAFMHRLATNKVVEAKTAVDADNLDGKDSSAFAVSGHDHDASYLTISGTAADATKLGGKNASAYLSKAIYDQDEDGVVDSAEVKIRYSDDDFLIDMAVSADHMRCKTAPVTFDTTTTVVTAGGLSLEPWMVPIEYEIWGDVYYSTNSGASWTILDNLSLEDTPPGGIGSAAIALNAVKTLDPGTYIFAIQPFGVDGRNGDDYTGYCQLTVTAYTGQGATTDVVVSPAG